MIEEQMPIVQKQDEDPTRCYVCGEQATATCARCKLAICDEHRQDTREYVTKVTMILCDECADYYEGIVKPDIGG